MKVLIGSVKDLNNSKLSITERGILISIILCKESDPKMTLAKSKVSFSFKDYKLELINLHEEGFILWSGYSAAVKALEKEVINPKVLEVINFMNNLYGRKFDAKSGSTSTTLISRLEQYTVDEIKKVIANRYSVWKDDKVMHIHLNPTTIFRAKNFDKYFEEVEHTKVGESFLNAESINLKEGDEITSEIVKTFIDKDTYSFKEYQVGKNGEAIGNGIKATRYGKDVKKLILLEESNLKFNGIKEKKYYYIAN
jgi:uncharacterized phage protein (TIGR02220 family)